MDEGLNAKHSQRMNEKKTAISDRPDLVLEEKYDENYQPSEEGKSRLYKWILNHNTHYFVSIYKYDIDIWIGILCNGQEIKKNCQIWFKKCH